MTTWLPSPFLRGSALFQLAGWPLAYWAGSTLPGLTELLLMNHALITLASLWPQSPLLGPNLVRLPKAERGEIALTFDDGPDPVVTPWVLDLLDHYGATASFFCIGERARRYPDLVREIGARGHRVENHGYSHRWNFALRGVAAIREELRRAQDTLTELAVRPPVFFRAPFGIRNPWIEPLLRPLGLRLASWSRRGYDGALGDPDLVTALLLRGLRRGDIVLLHDGGCARDRNGRPVVIAVLPRLLEEAARKKLRVRSLDQALEGTRMALGSEARDRHKHARPGAKSAILNPKGDP